MNSHDMDNHMFPNWMEIRKNPNSFRWKGEFCLTSKSDKPHLEDPVGDKWEYMNLATTSKVITCYAIL